MISVHVFYLNYIHKGHDKKKDRKIMNKCFNVYTEINMNTWIFTWLKIWSQVTVIFQKCVKYNVYEYKKVLRGK